MQTCSVLEQCIQDHRDDNLDVFDCFPCQAKPTQNPDSASTLFGSGPWYHPQCEYGEDEDLDVCFEKYKANKVISKYATFRCRSIMYPKMETYATACNDFPECVDEADEKSCSDNTALLIILPTTMAFIASMYLMLKLGRFTYHKECLHTILELTHYLRPPGEIDWEFGQNSDAFGIHRLS